MDSNINEYKDFAPIRMNSLDDKPMDGNSHYEINNFLLSHEKDIKENYLQNILDEALKLEKQCYSVLNYDKSRYKENSYTNNDKIVNYVLKNTEIDKDGRLIMPLIWNPKVKHLLGSNINLAKQDFLKIKLNFR